MSRSVDDTPLRQKILQSIRDAGRGSISFAEFMAACLYDPDHGYYASPAHRAIGRGGDFYTSVSVGDGFGFLLAMAIEKRWESDWERKTPLRIVEQGAHDGRLAIDVVSGLLERGIERTAFDYVIHEPDPKRRTDLATALAAAPIPAGLVSVESALPAQPFSAGIFLCNELPDAFPVHRVRWEQHQWVERRVEAGPDDTFQWISEPIPAGSDLEAEIEHLPSSGLPEHYTTEICTEYDAWMASVARWFHPRGVWWVIDYGLEVEDYFAPDRREGTLRGYCQHRRADDPFEAVGLTDLTTDVNFTRLDLAAQRAGLRRREFTDQHHFLIRAAEPWLRDIEAGGTEVLEKNRQRLRQFQTLTHPGMMGRTFKIAEYVRA